LKETAILLLAFKPQSNLSNDVPDHLMTVTQSSQLHINKSEETAEMELWDILQTNEEVKSVKRTGKRTQAASFKYIRTFAMNMNANKLEFLVDSCIGAVICGNALFTGMSMDAESDSSGWYLTAQVIFTDIFWAEMILKVYIHGCRQHYCGNDRLSNIFDATVIFVDTVQLVLLTTSSFNPVILRVVRLARLARVLRLLRSEVFKDLLSMILCMIGGLSTLLWAVAFFVIFIFIVAVISRDLVGRGQDNGEDNAETKMVLFYFSSVPRSMFTLFRCSFGDCSTKSGTPIFEHVTEMHGAVWSLAYSAFLFFVVIELFNVISAVFVSSTLTCVAMLASSMQQAKLDNRECWSENVMTLLKSLLMVEQSDMEGLRELVEGVCTEAMLCKLRRKLPHMSFPRHVIDWVVFNDEEALHALTKLDIDPADHKYLSDILDPANTGLSHWWMV